MACRTKGTYTGVLVDCVGAGALSTRQHRQGHTRCSQPGEDIFADQAQQGGFPLHKALHQVQLLLEQLQELPVFV